MPLTNLGGSPTLRAAVSTTGGEWTRESEAEAVARLQRTGPGGAPRPVVLIYTRQSVSDFNADGSPRGPSLNQQLDAVVRRPELAGLAVEHFEDADRSGKETSKRPGYLAMMERLRAADTGEVGAVAFYDADRLHRNDLEFFRFMAEVTERRILVFDANGLISNVDRLSWKIKAIVAQEEREKVSRRVRDNLRYLRENGRLLGVLPQGYRRVEGEIVEDAEAAMTIREIFRLYATGRFSVRSLADHLNRAGFKPGRGADKANHNRPKAVIFTGDVLKDILGNRSYTGVVIVDGRPVAGHHPALVDEATWLACQQVRARNQRRTSKAWTKHSYPLTPVLFCGRCGGPMHGESSTKGGRTDLYYACHHARRSRSAAHPRPASCDARWIATATLEDGIRDELGRCLPTEDLHEAFRAHLTAAAARRPNSAATTEARIRRLDEQLVRARRLYEYGEYDWPTFEAKRDEVAAEKQRLQAESADSKAPDIDWCHRQILDFVKTWDAGDPSQRARLLAGLFERLEAEITPSGRTKVVAVPRGAWRRFFEYVVVERETGFEPATSTLARLRSTE